MRYASDSGNDQFARAEAAGFNPYAGPSGRYEQPTAPPPPASPPPLSERERFEQQWQGIIDRYDEE